MPGSNLGRRPRGRCVDRRGSRGTDPRGGMNQQTRTSDRIAIPLLQPVTLPLLRPTFLVPRYVNVMCASLARGGAERQGIGLVGAWRAAGHRCKVIVFNDHKPAFDLRSDKVTTVVRLHGMDRS